MGISRYPLADVFEPRGTSLHKTHNSSTIIANPSDPWKQKGNGKENDHPIRQFYLTELWYWPSDVEIANSEAIAKALPL